MAHLVRTPTEILLAAMAEFKNHSALTMKVKRDFDGRFGREGHKIGDTIDVRRPQRFESKEQRALNLQDIYQPSVAVKLNKNRNIGLELDEIQRMLSIERLREDIIGPQASQLANDADFFLTHLYKGVWNAVGTPGTPPTTLAPFMKAKRVLHDNACPIGAKFRSMVYSPDMEENIVPALQALQNPAGTIGKQYEEGEMYRASGFDWLMSQNVAAHTVGAVGGTPRVNGVGQVATQDADGNWVQSLITDGWTNSVTNVLLEGDVIQIAGVYAVNPLTRESTRRLQDFRVKANASSGGSTGPATLSIEPPIITSGALQTVDSVPADDALISVFGVAAAGLSAIAGVISPQALAFHRDAIAFVMGSLKMPKMKEGASIADKDFGIAMRYVEDWDIDTGTDKTRLEILFGGALLRPEWIVRICG